MKIDQIIRSHRKTISIIVRRDGQLIVRAPFRTTNAQIKQFVEEKSGWITRKQAEARKRESEAEPRRFLEGERFWFLGTAYPLVIVQCSRPELELDDNRFLLSKAVQPKAKTVFTEWYKKQARTVLEERVKRYASRYHLTYQALRISSARTRWGSCSSRGSLSFPWRLVMAPMPVIDYVVIHELAHLLEKNHSKRFWEKVAAMVGDYAKAVDWLKQNGHLLTLE